MPGWLWSGCSPCQSPWRWPTEISLTLSGVKLLPRRNAETTADVVLEPTTDGGKGRPTPKRRDSAVKRGPVSAPKTRKEALARQKQQTRDAKAARATPARAMTPQQRRAALKSGDPAFLPRRDQGTTRKLARDYVDTHRMFSNYLLVLFPLMALSYIAPRLEYFVILVFIGLIVEWCLTGARVRKLAVARDGSAQGSMLSIGFYAGSRAYLPRRWRLPAPQKSLGETI
jgi:Protein of unknown function (DUF3043)